MRIYTRGNLEQVPRALDLKGRLMDSIFKQNLSVDSIFISVAEVKKCKVG
jgi:hypothetical protein